MEKSKLKKGIFWAAGIAVSTFLLVYLAGAYFFQKHYFWGTVIDGENYSLMTAKKAESILEKKAADYTLTIQGRNDIIDVIIGKDINLEPVFDGSLQQIVKEQNGFLWPFTLGRKREYEIKKFAEYDKEKLSPIFLNLNNLKESNRQEPENAYIGEYSEKLKQYAIVPEKQGSSIRIQKTGEAVTSALQGLKERISLEEEGCYRKPAVTVHSPTINKILNKLNRYVSAEIRYDYNDAKVVIDGDIIHEWLKVEGTRVIVDEQAVRDYVNGLARVHDTFGKKREFTKTNGETITIASGAYGFWTNRQTETKQLIEAVKAGGKTEREPVYHSRGYAPGRNDIGSSYVEIDLGSQHLYLYIDGEMILESDFVSGNPARGFQTPPGVYGLTYKERDATLRGQGYTSPVKFWMPFNGNIGMHDADWRREFGGAIYKTNGSHGCINLPPDIAEEIYSKVEQGFPVVCYE